MTDTLKRTRRIVWRGLVLCVAALVLASCGWRGIANVPLPGGPGSGPNKMTVYVQMPDTLALNVNSRVRVADVFVGSVRSIELKNWIATLTLDLDPGVELPENATARIGQTSLLGTQHIELGAPDNPSAQLLRNGDTIPLKNSSAYPTTERTLASIATVLNGGGIPNLEVIQNEVNNILDGNAVQIRDFLGKLDTFTRQLNEQRDDLTRAIDSTNQLLTIVAKNNETLDRVLTEFPPLIKYFADQRDVFADAVTALGRFSKATDETLTAARANLETNLQLLQRPLTQLERASPYLIAVAAVDADAAVQHRQRAQGGARRLHQRLGHVRPDAELARQRVPHRHRLLRRVTRTRTGLGARPQHHASGRPVHAEPQRRARWPVGGKG